MQSDTYSKLTQIWERLSNKEYRDQFVRSEIVSNVAAQVFALREKNEMTQSDLAKKSGMAQTRISVIESETNDNFTVGTLSKIAAAFDVAVVVRFVPFSELTNWVCGATEKLLAPQKFDDDSMNAQGRFAFLNPSGGRYAFPKVKLDELNIPFESDIKLSSKTTTPPINWPKPKLSTPGAVHVQ